MSRSTNFSKRTKKPEKSGFIAERTRFELVVEIAPYVGLANRWFQPLTHLSGHRFRSVSSERVCKYRIFLSNCKELRIKFLFFMPWPRPRNQICSPGFLFCSEILYLCTIFGLLWQKTNAISWRTSGIRNTNTALRPTSKPSCSARGSRRRSCARFRPGRASRSG